MVTLDVLDRPIIDSSLRLFFPDAILLSVVHLPTH